MLEPFIAAFTLALVSEIADKTQLVILGLALKYKSPWKVFTGAIIAHALMDGLAILLGTFLGFSLVSPVIKDVIGIIFILLGVWAFIKIYIKKKKTKEEKAWNNAPVAASFFMVLLSEFGDKTQIASGLLAAKYLVPIPIFVGFVAALGIAIGFNVFIGRKLAEKIPRKKIKIVTAVLFILFGILTLMS
ncbi:TMEM165/GDT1 family protein [Candidatus Woesearchaeota archaeon]|nr:TMEM165/GDT1 family protein [Candidatus Woesearchaeota archaeon]